MEEVCRSTICGPSGITYRVRVMDGCACVEKDDMPPLRRHMLSQVNEGGLQRKDIMPPLRHHMLSQKKGEGV